MQGNEGTKNKIKTIPPNEGVLVVAAFVSGTLHKMHSLRTRLITFVIKILKSLSKVFNSSLGKSSQVYIRKNIQYLPGREMETAVR